MTEDEKAQASLILIKPAKEWTKTESAFLYALIKKGHRQELKTLRVEAILDQ